MPTDVTKMQTETSITHCANKFDITFVIVNHQTKKPHYLLENKTLRERWKHVDWMILMIGLREGGDAESFRSLAAGWRLGIRRSEAFCTWNTGPGRRARHSKDNWPPLSSLSSDRSATCPPRFQPTASTQPRSSRRCCCRSMGQTDVNTAAFCLSALAATSQIYKPKKTTALYKTILISVKENLLCC